MTETRDIKEALIDVRRFLDGLGLLRGASKIQSGYLVCCPWHGEKHPSCAVQLRKGTIVGYCHSCGESGDVFAIIGSTMGMSPKTHFRQIAAEAARMAGMHELVEQFERRAAGGGGCSRGGAARAPEPTRPAVRDEIDEPERTYPPREQVLDLLEACSLTARSQIVSRWLLYERHLDPQVIDVLGLAHALPSAAAMPSWARYHGQSWYETGHRLIIPMYDATGQVMSVRAGRVVPHSSPKRLPPTGHKVGGLVMADSLGREVLQDGGWPEWHHGAPCVAINEGEPDWMSWASRIGNLDGAKRIRFACFGVVGGSWTAEVGSRLPVARVVIGAHHDLAGDKYVRQIRSTLKEGCVVSRVIKKGR